MTTAMQNFALRMVDNAKSPRKHQVHQKRSLQLPYILSSAASSPAISNICSNNDNNNNASSSTKSNTLRRRSATLQDAFKFVHGFAARAFHAKEEEDMTLPGLRDNTIHTCEMHTGGEPVRIIEAGLPEIIGETIMQKRAYLRQNFDHIRKLLMWEPRGHFDMYGALLVTPCHPDAHLGVLFMHNEGYSTMCGHAVIALARYAVDKEMVSLKSTGNNEVQVNIECPCGLVKSFVTRKPGYDENGEVRFESVPAFLFQSDISLRVEGIGKLTLDIAYGGTFYVLIEGQQLGIQMNASAVSDIVKTCNLVSDVVKESVQVKHPDPEHKDVEFVYGVIVTESQHLFDKQETKNICVFAESQVDRSPTGSGVTARMAALFAKGKVEIDQSIKFISGINNSVFVGKVLRVTTCGNQPAVIVEVKGHAYYCGKSEFSYEKNDPLSGGFLPKYYYANDGFK